MQHLRHRLFIALNKLLPNYILHDTKLNHLYLNSLANVMKLFLSTLSFKQATNSRTHTHIEIPGTAQYMLIINTTRTDEKNYSC